MVRPRVDTALSSGAQTALDEHMDSIRKSIVEEALSAHGTISPGDSIQPMQIMEAAKCYAPGHRISLQSYAPVPFWDKIFESISGITLMSAILAVVFGYLGWRIGTTGGAGLYDIAKIFAGAVVGSTGAAVAAESRTKSSR